MKEALECYSYLNNYGGLCRDLYETGPVYSEQSCPPQKSVFSSENLEMHLLQFIWFYCFKEKRNDSGLLAASQGSQDPSGTVNGSFGHAL